MPKGTVKWFNPAKGYGFIQPTGAGGKDVFVHITAVERAGFSHSTRGKSSSTKKCQIEAARQPRTLGFRVSLHSGSARKGIGRYRVPRSWIFFDWPPRGGTFFMEAGPFRGASRGKTANVVKFQACATCGGSRQLTHRAAVLALPGRGPQWLRRLRTAAPARCRKWAVLRAGKSVPVLRKMMKRNHDVEFGLKHVETEHSHGALCRNRRITGTVERVRCRHARQNREGPRSQAISKI